MNDLALSIRITGDAKGLRAEVVGAEGVLKDLSAAGGKAGKGLEEMGRDADKAGREMRELGQQSEGLAASLRILPGLIAAIGLGALAGNLVATNREFQSLAASLKTVTGSTEAAKAAMAEIERFATQTPYQLQEVVQAFIKLKAAGLDPSMEALRSYGNTASSMSKTLDDFIEAIKDATRGEFERLKEFTVDASKQGDQIAFTFQGITTVVRKNTKEIEGYLRSLGEANFAGAMAAQMETIGGKLSNLGDSISQFYRAVGDAGFNTALTEVIDQLIATVGSSDDLARSLGENMAEGLRTASAGFSLLSEHGTELKMVLGGLIGLQLASWLHSAAAATVVFTGAVRANPVLMAGYAIAAAIGAVTAGVWGLYDGLGAEAQGHKMAAAGAAEHQERLKELGGEITKVNGLSREVAELKLREAKATHAATSAKLAEAEAELQRARAAMVAKRGIGAGAEAKALAEAVTALSILRQQAGAEAGLIAELETHLSKLGPAAGSSADATDKLRASFESLRASLDPLFKLESERVEATAVLDQALAQRLVNEQQHAALLDEVTRRYYDARAELEDVTTAVDAHVAGVAQDNAELALQIAGREDAIPLLRAEAALREKLGRELLPEEAKQLRAVYDEQKKLNGEIQAQEKARRAAEKYADEVLRVADDLAGDVADYTVRGLTEGFENGFDGIWDSVKRWLLDLGALILKQHFILPVTMQVVGSAPSLFGIQAPGGGTGGQIANVAGQIAGGGGGGGGFGYGGDMINLGSSLLSGATWTTGSVAMGNTFASVGNWLGGAETAATFGNAGLNLSSLSGMAGGFVGNLGANLLLGDRGMAANIGGTLGAIAGSFIPIPSVGTAIGAFLGNAIGGLFGSKKKDPYGRVVVEPRGEKGFGYTSITEGGYPSKATGEIGKALVGLFRKVGETLDLEIDTYSGGQYGVYVQGKSESEIRDKMFLQLRRGLLNGLYEDVPKALRRALMDMEDAPTEASVTRVLDDFLRTKEGLVAALEEMSKAAEKAQSPFTAMIDNFKAQMKALKEGVADFGLDPAQVTAAERNQLGIIRDNVNETLRRELLGLTDPKALALEQWAEWAIALRRDVKTIGGDLVTAERLIAEKRLQVLEQYGERMVDEQRRTAAQQLAAAQTLRQWLDGQLLGDLSSLSPTERLGEAQRQFDTIVASARGGDEAAFERVTGQASALLEAAQAVFGSTRGFVEIEERVRAAIAGLGRSLDLPGFAAGGLVTGGTPGRDSVPALLMPGERVFSVPHSRLLERLAANANDSGETVAELRRVTATLEATAQRAAGQAAAENRALRAAIARLETRLEELEAPLRRAVAR